MNLAFKSNLARTYAAFLVCFSPLLAYCQTRLQPFVTTCKADEEISAKNREAIGEVVLKFVQDAIGSSPSAAYALFTQDAKTTVPEESFVNSFQGGIKPMGPFRDLRVVHTYIARVTGGTQSQRVVCGNLSSLSTWVSVNVKPGPAEAYAVIEGKTVNNTVAFILWLITQDDKWRVQYVQYAITSMVGKSSEDLQKMAVAENERHHNLNAFLLYATALQLSDRGPFFQLGVRPEIEQALQAVQRPTILQGQAPFVWNFEKSTFKVLNVGLIGVGGQVYLEIDHEIEPWKADGEADQINRELIARFAKVYPEYREAFAGLVVRAHERGGNRGYGTVDPNQK